ncbi:MAG: hypothetical protein Q8R34_00380 [bacterium]|nr:hypothetical protein [bacterium]
MSILTLAIIVGLLTLSSSGFFLKYVLKFDCSIANCLTPLAFTLIGVMVSTQLKSFSEAVVFFGAAIIQFASFVFSSRFRQRSSFLWITLASLAANGTWYATMNILAASGAYWLLFVPHILGIIAGRTIGVVWASYIERTFNLKSNAVADNRLAPGQRLALLGREWSFWVLVLSLLCYLVYGYLYFSPEIFISVLIVIGLGLLQNFSYALSSRASARGNNWYIVGTSLFAGATFYFSVIYLFTQNMSWSLFIPYTLSTTIGANIGTFFSMVIEWVGKLSPDKHLEKMSEVKKEGSGQRLPYFVIIGLATVWIFFQENIFQVLGYSVTPLRFPISAVTIELPRTIVMFFASFVFLFSELLHTVNSRAGNRNHTGYHVATCVPKGLMDFSRISYIALNSRIPDVLPISILAGCLGSLYGKDISEKIERWLQARMDVEPVKKPALSS